MNNINKNIKNVNDLDYKLKVAYHKAKEDPVFTEIISSIDLSDDKLIKYTSMLEDSSKEYANCKKCKGLKHCKNSFKGYCYLPVINNEFLDFSYIECRYKKDYDDANRYIKKVTAINIPEDIRNAKIKEIYTDDNKRTDVIKWVLNYIKEYKRNVIEKGLFLHGNFGCGKTYLISALFNELAKYGEKSVIIYWPEYLRELKASYSSSNSDEFKNKYNEVKYAKYLLIDDLGAEGVTSWSRDEILGTILQYRMQDQRPTFITSNLNIKELEDHLSITTTNKSEKVKAKRIIERIKQLTIDIEMIGENKRN